VIELDVHKSKELRGINQLKSNFLSIVSHELCAPLSVVKEGIGVVLDGIEGPVNEGQKEVLEIAARNVDRLSQIIENILDYTKLETGKIQMRFEKVLMNNIVNEAFQLMNSMASERGFSLTSDLCEQDILAVCDPERIKQVIIKLIENAIEFTEPGGSIFLRLARSNDSVRIEVENTSQEIPETEFEKIFEIFTQSRTKEGKKITGSGLGLAICKKIIERHHGKIFVEAAQKKGSRFVITLPCNHLF